VAVSASAPDSKTRLRLWLGLLRTTRRIENGLRERLRTEHGTTLPRFDVLAMLYRTREGLRMSDLSDQLMVSNGNVTGVVERLVQDGLVERLPVPGDRRATLIRLTGPGVASFERMAADHEAWIGGVLAEIDVGEAQAMIDSLRRIRRATAAR
jgi:DNA-binding MarR family transcriptional regulator